MMHTNTTNDTHTHTVHRTDHFPWANTECGGMGVHTMTLTCGDLQLFAGILPHSPVLPHVSEACWGRQVGSDLTRALFGA